MPTCQSTNDEAAALLRQNSHTPEGTCLITDTQTAGRGQRGNTWEAASGQNLTFSLIIKPVFLAATAQFQLNVAITLAIAELLGNVYAINDVYIKWPNDIYVKEQKICGILIENLLQGAQIGQSIVGIGLNINQITFDNPRATSLALLKSKTTPLPEVFGHLCHLLEKYYLQLRAGNYNSLKAKYLQQLYKRGELSAFADATGQPFEGEIIGINEAGQLAVQTNNTLRYFSFKEIVYL